MGITPTLVSGCWVGGDDRDIHFDSMEYGQGASMALPIFAYYMKKVYADAQLPYNQSAVFDLDKDYNPCQFTIEGYDSGEMSEIDFDLEEVYE